MTDLRSLEQTLADNLPWNKARIKFVSRFLLALYAVQTVNLARLATAFAGAATEAAHYKRLQRFLHHFELPYAELAQFVVKLLGVPGPYCRISCPRSQPKSRSMMMKPEPSSSSPESKIVTTPLWVLSAAVKKYPLTTKITAKKPISMAKTCRPSSRGVRGETLSRLSPIIVLPSAGPAPESSSDVSLRRRTPSPAQRCRMASPAQ